MTPTPETCRRLTLYLGECWHEIYTDPSGRQLCSCGCECEAEITAIYHQKLNRHFTTPADLFAVYGKMVEKGEWEKFEQCQWDKSHTPHKDGEFTAWLFCLSDPSQIGERMEMAAKWLEE